MINPMDHKKKDAEVAQDKNQMPDSTTALCENLVSKLTEKDDKPKHKKLYKPKDTTETVEISDSDESDKESDDDDDEESDWSSATASPAPLKVPRAFEKSDHLYEKKMEKKKGRTQEIEDWSWESEDSLEERPISKQVNVIKKKNKN